MSIDYHPRDMSVWDPWFVVRGDTVHLFHQQGRLAAGSDRDATDGDAIGQRCEFRYAIRNCFQSAHDIVSRRGFAGEGRNVVLKLLDARTFRL